MSTRSLTCASGIADVDSLCKIAAGLPSPSAQLSQSLRRLRDHVYSPLQFLLQVGDVHLVRDAIGVTDALHIAVLHHILQTLQGCPTTLVDYVLSPARGSAKAKLGAHKQQGANAH